MANLSLVVQLTMERDRIAKQLSGLNAAITAFAGAYSGSNGKRQISASGKKSIAAAQRARWAKVRGEAKAVPKRAMSAATRKKVAAAQRARWAKVIKAKRAA
jgi:hypothetical protein